jgi:uncharacterized protein YkwD
MTQLRHLSLFLLALAAGLSATPRALVAQVDSPQGLHAEAAELFALGNQARISYRKSALNWDPTLAAAAMQHCLLMARNGNISHQYNGEPEVSDRAATAGAHFSLIEENVAMGPDASGIHQGWMKSPGHRENLLSPEVDRVGIAVVARGNELFAVADFARAVPVLSQAQVEADVAGNLRARGLTVLRDPNEARAYCASSGRYRSTGIDAPNFLMRWQDADPAQLPQELIKKALSGEFHQAAVGSCPAQGDQPSFTVYRVAVLLYATGSAAFPTR